MQANARVECGYTLSQSPDFSSSPPPKRTRLCPKATRGPGLLITVVLPSSSRIRGSIEMATIHHRGKPLPIIRHRDGIPLFISRGCALCPSSSRIRGGVDMAAPYHRGISPRTGKPELTGTGDAQDRVLSQSPRPFGGKTRVAAQIACSPKASSLVESRAGQCASTTAKIQPFVPGAMAC